MDVIKQLSLVGLVPVIKVEDAGDAVPLCRALAAGGLPVAEITFRSEAAEEAIRRVHEELPEVILGAGTVLTTEQVDRAVAAGASYIVSPGINRPVRLFRCQHSACADDHLREGFRHLPDGLLGCRGPESHLRAGQSALHQAFHQRQCVLRPVQHHHRHNPDRLQFLHHLSHHVDPPVSK